MNKVLVLILVAFTLSTALVAYADEALPEIAAVDEVSVAPLADFVPAE